LASQITTIFIINDLFELKSFKILLILAVLLHLTDILSQ